jgi:hypothetical protein
MKVILIEETVNAVNSSLSYNASTDQREILRRIENREIHFGEAERVFVCRDESVNKSKLPPAVLDHGQVIGG